MFIIPEPIGIAITKDEININYECVTGAVIKKLLLLPRFTKNCFCFSGKETGGHHHLLIVYPELNKTA